MQKNIIHKRNILEEIHKENHQEIFCRDPVALLRRCSAWIIEIKKIQGLAGNTSLINLTVHSALTIAMVILNEQLKTEQD